MADVKISALPASAGLAAADLFAVVDDPGGTPATQKATLTQLITLLTASFSNLSGSGSPEGVQTASVPRIYFDISSTTNPGMWVKTTGTGNTGWAEVLAVGP